MKKTIMLILLFNVLLSGQNLHKAFLLNEHNFIDDKGNSFTIYAPGEVDLKNSFFDRIMGLQKGLRTYVGRKESYQRVILDYLISRDIESYRFVEASLVSELTKLVSRHL